MKQFFFLSTFFILASCGRQNTEQPPISLGDASDSENRTLNLNNGSNEAKNNPSDFLPTGYVLFKQIMGDLNADGVEDCVLVIKGTDSKQIITDENHEKVDRNRRGIIVILNKNGYYEAVVNNVNCFSSEHEDGGVYFAPELSVTITNGNLIMHYAHGRYGYWAYTFRLQNLDLELIGYDQSENKGPVVEKHTSINFISLKKQTKVNTNSNASEEAEVVFKETWSSVIKVNSIKLSEIKDFDSLDMSVY
jgi:hypothetical protein